MRNGCAVNVVVGIILSSMLYFNPEPQHPSRWSCQGEGAQKLEVIPEEWPWEVGRDSYHLKPLQEKEGRNECPSALGTHVSILYRSTTCWTLMAQNSFDTLPIQYKLVQEMI